MVRFQPVVVAKGYEEAGVLAFRHDRLVAVLVRLTDEDAIAPGRWYLEQGRLCGEHPTLANLDEAVVWLARRVSG